MKHSILSREISCKSPYHLISFRESTSVVLWECRPAPALDWEPTVLCRDMSPRYSAAPAPTAADPASKASEIGTFRVADRVQKLGQPWRHTDWAPDHDACCVLQISEPLTECSIGAKLSGQESGLGLPLSSLSGQMGCIYLFEAPLSEGVTHGRLENPGSLVSWIEGFN